MIPVRAGIKGGGVGDMFAVRRLAGGTEHPGKFLRPSLFNIKRQRVGQEFFKRLGSLFGRIDAIQTIAIDGAEKHFESFNLIEKPLPSDGWCFQQKVEKNV